MVIKLLLKVYIRNVQKKPIRQDKNKDSEIFKNKNSYKTIMQNIAKEAYKDLK